jgi:hypothetical protein
MPLQRSVFGCQTQFLPCECECCARSTSIIWAAYIRPKMLLFLLLNESYNARSTNIALDDLKLRNRCCFDKPTVFAPDWRWRCTPYRPVLLGITTGKIGCQTSHCRPRRPAPALVDEFKQCSPACPGYIKLPSFAAANGGNRAARHSNAGVYAGNR